MAKNKQSDTFSEWVRRFGVMNLAQKFGCHQTTVESWANRRVLPTVPNMRALIEIAKGEIEYSDIIEPYFVVNPSSAK